MTKYFYPILNPENKYLIGMDESIFNLCYTDSSYNVLFCRLLGLSYANGWRYMRDYYGAEIHGKMGKYCHATFNDKSKCTEFCKLLTERWVALLNK